MKTTEFRIWDTKNKEYDNEYIAVQYNGTLMWLTPTYEKWEIAPKNRFKLEYYIGQKDINSTKIHEGDIVEIYSTITKTTTKGHVYYEEKTAAFLIDDAIFKQYIPITKDDTIKVIGNIHEHPNLLKE